MTDKKTEALKLALEAGFENSEYGLNCTPGMYAYNMEIIERFADLVAAAEREECAKILETNAKLCSVMVEDILRANAAAIRARGETK